MHIIEHTGQRRVAVEAGEVVAVLGSPASGKTTLGLEMAFLARPIEGEVLFHGVDPLRKQRGRGKRPVEVTMLVQNAEDQLFARTIFDDVAFGPRHRFLPDDEVEARVERSLRTVGLDFRAIRDRSPFALSGGERRRVALAGVLAMDPEVVVLDEPTSNLDPQTQAEFIDLLAPLRGRASVVWLTSSAEEASNADRIYLLSNESTSELPSGTLLSDSWRRLAQAGVELPAIYTLAGALERRGHSLPQRASPAEMEDSIVLDWRATHDR